MTLQLTPTPQKSLETDQLGAVREMESAGQVQRRLMQVREPHSSALEYDGRCLPAGSVGGDYFDLLQLPSGRLGLAVGDVSGKGLSAALMMAALHASLRTFYAAGPASLDQALVAVNDIFRRSTSSRHYASLFLAEYDAHQGILYYGNCGHVAPLVVRRDGEIIRLHSTSTVLGIFADWTPASRCVPLSPGDTLIAFSDGISEAAGPDEEQFGDARLTRAASAGRHLPVADLGEALLSTCRQFAGTPQEDDMTLVVARVKSAATAARGPQPACAERSQVA